MKVEMNDNGEINLSEITVDQVSLLTDALRESPNQKFMDDGEMNRMFNLLAILQSRVFQNSDSGKVDFSEFNSGVS